MGISSRKLVVLVDPYAAGTGSGTYLAGGVNP